MKFQRILIDSRHFGAFYHALNNLLHDSSMSAGVNVCLRNAEVRMRCYGNRFLRVILADVLQHFFRFEWSAVLRTQFINGL